MGTWGGMGSSSSQPEGSIYNHTLTDADGQQVSLREYEGKVMLIVNVASK